MGILLCEHNFRDVWIRNKSVRAEIGQILHTDTHPHTHNRGKISSKDYSYWSSQWGSTTGNICGAKCFMMYINDLSTPVPLYKYVDDSTLCEICEMNSISLMQESVNIAAEWTNNNDMEINSEKSKEKLTLVMHMVT